MGAPSQIDSSAIMALLQETANEVAGGDVPITRDTRMDQFLAEVKATDLNCAELSIPVESRLGIRLSAEDWSFLAGDGLVKSREEWEAKYAPFFTFGRLADLLAYRANLGAVQSITVLGAASISAGAFRRIEEFLDEIDPRADRLGPSTPIMDRVRGPALQKLWGRLRSLSANRIPPLKRGRLRKVLDLVFEGLHGALLAILLFALSVWGIYEAISQYFDFGRGTFLIASASSLFGTVFLLRALDRLANRLGSPETVLPKDVRVFRDLAELVSGDRGGWCDKCGYDLTGLTGRNCPECGTVFSINHIRRPVNERPVGADSAAGH